MSGKFFSIILLLLVVSTGFFGYRLYLQDKKPYLNGQNILYKTGDVLGVSSDETDVAIDFSKQVSTGTALTFGGAHAPRLTDTKAWDAIEAAGITSIRLDFFLDRYLPKTTVEQYKQNVNNVQDISTWSKKDIHDVQGVYQEAHKRNMKTIGILAYNVKWLSKSNTNYGVPTDWAVFDDVVEKSYRIFRSDLDYLEIWNEPDMDVFMDTKNSGLKKEEAYLEIVKHSIAIIRRVDDEIGDGKRMKIGAGVTATPTNTYILEKVLSDASVRPHIDFVSYHNYEHIKEPSSGPVSQLLKKYNMPNTPIFLTEWAHSPQMKKADAYVLENQAIPYAGAKLIDYLKMGLAGTSYFSMQPIQPESPRGDEGMLGFYTGAGDTLTMLPIIKTWTLMSKTMGLGQGNNKVYAAEGSNEKVAGFVNANNEYSIVLSNQNFQLKTFNFTLYNLPAHEDFVMEAYVASGDQNGKNIVGTSLLKNQASGSSFKAVIPSNSVVGIKFRPATWKDKLPL